VAIRAPTLTNIRKEVRIISTLSSSI